MKRVLILVEGQTEEIFVKRVLAPHLQEQEIYVIPTIVTTKRVKIGKNFKGGVHNYAKIKKETQKLLRDSSADLVTTMIDYYGLPNSFPGKNVISGKKAFDRVEFLEKAFAKDIGHPKFHPYFSLHEFEALLFTSPETIAMTFTDLNKQDLLNQIKASFNSPEEIDDDPETTPSRRLKKIFPGYQKTLHGSLISNRIGIESIRTECSHFNSWLKKLESLN